MNQATALTIGNHTVPDFFTIDDFDVENKTVLLRADLNVPVKDGQVSDNQRLVRLLPTLRDLSIRRAKIVILSHFGRPKGQEPDLSLRVVAQALEALWMEQVAFADDCIGPTAEAAIAKLEAGQVLVLENTRFHAGEKANDPAFIKALASMGDLYINDAFSTAHRGEASTEGLTHYLPSGAGRLMQEELNALTSALTTPDRPLAAVVGGSNISTKLDLLNNLINKVDVLVLGGGMANTFLAAKGVAIGKSLSEPDMYDTARQIMAKAEARGCTIMLPQDVVVATTLKAGIETKIVSVHAVPEDMMILDLGPEAAQEIIGKIGTCKTLVWNGPLGAFEFKPFDNATNTVAAGVAELTKRGKLMSVAGGGDTVAAMANAGVTGSVSYLSTAGGAFLEWLEGKELPAVVALRNATHSIKKA